ncbi:hypothetical protein ATE48_17000 [Candidatus Viadribacter manganicus]|uniref:Uncharacterized protein n=1 Tax=Candidatus Viadribacter manganicus TaxID=1759059 RepID=A0A1B1ALS9_9PROT|nr:hypothetical protein ATE48_17000 [Candidatus Viadribacter manganicus]
MQNEAHDTHDLSECELILAEKVISGRSLKDIALSRGLSEVPVSARARRALMQSRVEPPNEICTYK